MKKSLKIGLFLAGFLMISTGCSKSYCSEADINNIKEITKEEYNAKFEEMLEQVKKQHYEYLEIKNE